jgi:hypothetical protein
MLRSRSVASSSAPLIYVSRTETSCSSPVRAFDFQGCLPSSLKALRVGLDAGGNVLVRCRTGEKQRGHLRFPPRAAANDGKNVAEFPGKSM